MPRTALWETSLLCTLAGKGIAPFTLSLIRPRGINMSRRTAESNGLLPAHLLYHDRAELSSGSQTKFSHQGCRLVCTGGALEMAPCSRLESTSGTAAAPQSTRLPGMTHFYSPAR